MAVLHVLIAENTPKWILNTMVEKIIFGYILRINGTLDNHLPSHGSSVYNFNQIHEILLGLEAAHKLGVIWRAGREVILLEMFPYDTESIGVWCVNVQDNNVVKLS